MPLKKFTAKKYFGRRSELASLKALSSAACSGSASSVILSGRRGVGKTELLRRCYNTMFHEQTDVVPFFLTVKSAFVSVENFSRDYLGTVLLQSLAFQRRDASLITSGIYSMDDLRYLAEKDAMPWVSEMIDEFNKISGLNDPVRLFSCAVSAPYQVFRRGGKPVVAMIDDFHKLRKLSSLSAGSESANLWMVYEDAIGSCETPHVITGLESELYRMFFEETSFGNDLETIRLQGLDGRDAGDLFESLCEGYSVSCDQGITELISVFSGNPYYIRSLVQAARHEGVAVEPDNFWDLYANEVTGGKMFTCWTSFLKKYITRFAWRKPALHILMHMLRTGLDADLKSLAESLPIPPDELDQIVDVLHVAGTLESGFSTIGVVDDAVLIDVIRWLYYSEIEREPAGRIRELITGDRQPREAAGERPLFDITVPAVPRAELVAVRSLEHAAGHFGVPSAMIGKLQVALVELFTHLLSGRGPAGRNYQVRFRFEEGTFSVEVDSSLEQSDLAGPGYEEILDMIRANLDELRVERTITGTRIIMIKNISGEKVPAG